MVVASLALAGNSVFSVFLSVNSTHYCPGHEGPLEFCPRPPPGPVPSFPCGSKRIRAQRLWEHTHPDDTTGSDNMTSQESEDDGGSTTSHSPATSAADSSGTEDNSIPYTSDMRFTLASRQPSRCHHCHRQSPRSHRRSPSSSSSSNSEPARSRSRTPRPRHRTRQRTRHRTHHQHRRDRQHRHHKKRHSYHSTVPISRYLQQRIVRGEFIEFTELLGELTVAGGAGVHSCTQKCHVAPIASLQSWLQAFSTFAEVLSSASPSIAKQLWRYQSFIICSSQCFQPHAWLQYDLQFRRKL